MPAAARVLEVVAREMVVAEEESIFVLRAYRDATTEPNIGRVLDTLLQDEVRHAAAGRELYGLLKECLPAEAIAALLVGLPETMASDRLRLRHGYSLGAIDGPGRCLGVSLRPDDLRGRGVRRRSNWTCPRSSPPWDACARKCAYCTE